MLYFQSKSSQSTAQQACTHESRATQTVATPVANNQSAMNNLADNRTWIAAMLGLFLMMGTGCEALEYRPSAVGREGEVIVVIDSLSWSGPLGDAVRANLAPYLGTLPAPEREFTLRRISLTSQRLLETIQKQKNVVFVAPLEDETAEAEFLRTRLDETALSAVMSGQASVIPRRDLWRSGQQVIYLLGDTEESIIDLLDDRGEDIRYQFNEITRQRLNIDMFEKGRRFELEDTLMSRHSFAVRGQHDYFIAVDTTDFVWMRRVVNSDSWRSLWVYYIEDFNPANLTPEWIYEARERLTETHIRGNMGGFVAIDFRRELTSENIDFIGRFAYETRGLWHMVGEDPVKGRVEYGMGGPFLNYTFYDDETGRLYMIDGMVFAPGYDKREFLRHMEVISHSFWTAEEALAAAAETES